VKQFVLLLVGILLPLCVQAQSSKSFVATVTGFRTERAEVEVKPDSGDIVVGQLTSDTLAQKIAPGEKDLKKAETIAVTELAKGDRVLVTLEPDSTRIRRIVVMSAKDIAGRNEADRLDWQKRGVAGIVSAKNGNEIMLRNKTLTAESLITVTVNDRTSIKRYAPDSVKFADAQPATLPEIRVGDQVRARGDKSLDGQKVAASDLVFGTFVIEAGAISAIDPGAQEIKVKELGGNKLLTVKFTADSQIRQMFDMPPMAGRAGGAGMAAGGPPRGGPGGLPGGFDINQMIEHLPAVKLEDLKPGATVVISSTKGAKSDQLTAILLLSNAGMLVQMASAMKAANGAAAGAGGMGGAGMGGTNGADLSGLMGLGIGGMNQ
jgi:hypothetical protein